MVVQLGETRTLTYIHWRGAPIVCREITWGSRELTLALAKRYGSVPQAEQTNSITASSSLRPTPARATPEQVDFSDAILGTGQTAHLASAPKQSDLQKPHAGH